MPAKVEKRGDRWRVVEPDGSLVTQNGSPVDGGGHNLKQKALDQAAAINVNERSSNGK